MSDDTSSSRGKSKYIIPDLSNATPGFLLDQVKEYRDKKSEAEFYEKFYRAALDARRDGEAVESERYIGNFVSGSQVRIDSDAIRDAFSPEELRTRGFLKEISMVTLKILERK